MAKNTSSSRYPAPKKSASTGKPKTALQAAAKARNSAVRAGKSPIASGAAFTKQAARQKIRADATAKRTAGIAANKANLDRVRAARKK